MGARGDSLERYGFFGSVDDVVVAGWHRLELVQKWCRVHIQKYVHVIVVKLLGIGSRDQGGARHVVSDIQVARRKGLTLLRLGEADPYAWRGWGGGRCRA